MSDEERPDALGFAKMPPGYQLIQLDSGYWIWVEEATGRGCEVEADRWAVYRGAVKDYKRTRRTER